MFKPSSSEKIHAWEERILQQQTSGLSIDRWCRENQVAVCQFHYWKGKLFPRQITHASFAELPHAKGVGLMVECNSIRIHLDSDFDALTLKRCLAIIKEVQC